MKYKTVTEMIKIWGLPERTIRYYCSTGKILNVKKEGKKWLIPENAKLPGKKLVSNNVKSVEPVIQKAEKQKLSSATKIETPKEKVVTKKANKVEKQKVSSLNKKTETIKNQNSNKKVADKVNVDKNKKSVQKPIKQVADKPIKNEIAPLPPKEIKKSLLLLLNIDRINEKKDGIYSELANYFTYNTNKLDGSKMSLEDVLFLSGAEKGIIMHAIKVKEFIDTINSFSAFAKIVESGNSKLTIKLLKELNDILNTNLNDVAPIPKGKQAQISKFVAKYNSKENMKISDIAKFHVQFLKNDLFGNNTAKIARLLLLKECLKQDITPIILSDDLKKYYDRGISEWVRQQMFLIDTFRLAQEDVDKLLVKYKK